jgi:hypothetical protein
MTNNNIPLELIAIDLSIPKERIDNFDKLKNLNLGLN